MRAQRRIHVQTATWPKFLPVVYMTVTSGQADQLFCTANELPFPTADGSPLVVFRVETRGGDYDATIIRNKKLRLCYARPLSAPFRTHDWTSPTRFSCSLDRVTFVSLYLHNAPRFSAQFRNAPAKTAGLHWQTKLRLTELNAPGIIGRCNRGLCHFNRGL